MAEITSRQTDIAFAMMIQRANSFIQGHLFTGIPNALSVSFSVPRFSDQGHSEGSESLSDSRISRVRVGRTNQGSSDAPISRPRDRPAMEKKAREKGAGIV